jgi:hypothetical protein
MTPTIAEIKPEPTAAWDIKLTLFFLSLFLNNGMAKYLLNTSYIEIIK